MATKSKDIQSERKIFNHVCQYLSDSPLYDRVTIDLLLEKGGIQTSTIVEHAIASCGGLTVVGLDTNDFSDGSDGKYATARLRSQGSTLSAEIKGFKNKIGSLRVLVLVEGIDEFHYYVFPPDSYENKSSIEIPFNLCGTPVPFHWTKKYKKESFKDMACHPNEGYPPGQSKVMFDSLFEYD